MSWSSTGEVEGGANVFFIFIYILIELREKIPADLEGQIYDAQVSIVNK